MSILAAVSSSEPCILGVEASLGGRRWRDRLSAGAAQAALAMAQRHGLPEIVARVMAGRGVAADDAPAYLDPTLKTLLPEPYSLTDMEPAAERIASAVAGRERIAVFADYDVDGATSAALMLRFLRHYGLEPALYVPDRLTEGYGPNPAAIRALAERGTALLILVDCGTTSHDSLEEARRLGLDVVAVDHHQADETLPPTIALVNPNRQDDLSGLGHLAAVGVVFLVLVAVNRILRGRGLGEAPLLSWLELVALGTVCDVVPLVGLNRAFVAKGLMALRARRFVGLRLLADLARVHGPIGCYHLGFLIGPRINAGGRIGRAEAGALLLSSDDEAEALNLARELDTLNAERQALERIMLEHATAQAEAALAADPDLPVLITSSADWHPGLVGLIASRLKERYSRPAFALALDETGAATGSGRSIAGVDLGAAVRAARAGGLLTKGGGHAMAAGLTAAAVDIPAVSAFFAERLGGAVALAWREDVLSMDGAMSAAGADIDLVRLLEKAGPYGAGNPNPRFVFPAHRIASAAIVGDGHVRASLASGDGARLGGVAFRAAETPLGKALLEARGGALHVAGSLRLDHWNGREKVELHIADAALLR